MSRLNGSYNLVKEFITVFQQDGPCVDTATLDLSANLITEEYHELLNEFMNLRSKIESGIQPELSDLVAFVKELTDLEYVVHWCAARLNIDLREAYERVHISNMSNCDDNGKPIFNERGKVLKSKNYKPAVLDDISAKIKPFVVKIES